MSITREDKDGKATLKIEGSMSIYEAKAIRAELLVSLTNDEELTLDLNGVTDCDIACLQLLFSAQKTAAEEGKGFCISGTPTPVRNLLRDAGINSEGLFNLEFEAKPEKEE